MIVADANVLVYLLVETPMTPFAERLAQSDRDWCVPELWQFEFTNAIASVVRSNGMSRAHGEKLIGVARSLFEPLQFPVDQVAAYRTAFKYRISPYDAQYVTLAETLDVKCVTADRQVLERVPRWTMDLGAVARW